MKRPYYLFSNGPLRPRQNTLLLERADAERTPDDDPADTGEPSGAPTGEKVPFPVEQVDAVYVFGEIDINTKLVTILAQQSIPVHFFEYYGHYTATPAPREYLHSGRLKVLCRGLTRACTSTRPQLALLKGRRADHPRYPYGRILSDARLHPVSDRPPSRWLRLRHPGSGAESAERAPR